MTIAELKQRKRELGYTNQMVATASGVPLGTIQKIFGNITKSPRYETLQMIEKALFPENFGGHKTKGVYNTPDDPYEPVRVAEDNLAYQYESDPCGVDGFNFDSAYSYCGRKQGEFTIDVIMSLPEGVRVELIDGMLYDMAPPTTVHQVIAQQMLIQISFGIEENNGECIPLIAPVGVKLHEDDNKNYLEPDVVVVCDRGKIHRDMVHGAPDFVAEVLSPSTRGRDMYLKLVKYQGAGVREYWIIDPDSREITVYNFESLRITRSYSFDNSVPVGIFDEKVSIDFSKIGRQLDSLFG